MIPLLMDTDIGGDIDDALALSMALNAPQVRLLGVTTVYIGNAWRTDIVRRMLRAYRRADVPVCFGAQKPLAGSWGDADDTPNEAVPFIIETARRAPCVLLAIGPMTNVALALKRAPDIANRLTIYAMGGMLTQPRPEWNILCDPEAADIVLTSGARVTLVGLNVTESCRLTLDESHALVAGADARMTFLRGEMERFLTQFSFLPTLHDPLALLCLLQPDICRYETLRVCVNTGRESERGVTTSAPAGENSPVRVAMAVNAPQAVRAICALVRGDPTFDCSVP